MSTAKTITTITTDVLVGYGIGAVSGAFVATIMPRSTNPAFATFQMVSGLVTGVVVGSYVQEKHLKPYTDENIDKIFALIEHHSQR